MAGELGHLIVRIGADLRGLKTGLDKARGHVSSWQSKNKNAMRGFMAANKGMFNSVANNALIMGTAIVAATGMAVKSFAEFGKGMAFVQTMLDDTTKKFMPEYEKGIRRLAEESGDSFASLQKGLYDVLSAMIPAEQAMDVLTEANKAAVAGMSSTAVAVDGLTTIMNSFGLAGKDAGEVSDWFFTIVKRGKTTFDELAPSIGKVAPIASSAGIELNELGAMMALLTRNGVKTDIAITSLKAVITAFQKPSADAKKLAKELGFEMSASSLKANGLSWAMKQVNKASEDQMAVLVGNIRAKLATAVATQNLAELEEDLAAMTNKAGNTQEAYNIMNATTAKQLERLKMQFLNLMHEAIRPLIPIIRELLDHVKGGLDVAKEWIENNKEQLKAWVLLIAKIGPLMIGLAGLIKLMLGLSTAVNLVKAGVNGVTWALANPLITAIVIVVGMLALLIAKWLELRNAQKKAQESVEGAVNKTIFAVEKEKKSLSGLSKASEKLTAEERARISTLNAQFDALRQQAEMHQQYGATVEDATRLTRMLYALDERRKVLSEEITERLGLNTEAQKESNQVQKEGVEIKQEAVEASQFARSDIEKESIEVLEMTAKYRELNQALAEGKVTKDEYSLAVNDLIQEMVALGMPIETVLEKLNELDETDPNIDVKMRIFGMEKIIDVKERIKRINEDIVLSQLDGDERTRKSLEFNLAHELNAIEQKLRAAKFAHAEKMLILQAEFEREQTQIILSTQANEALQNKLLEQLRSRIEKQKALEAARWADLQALYDEEAEAHKALTESKLDDLGDQIDGYQRVANAQRSASSTARSYSTGGYSSGGGGYGGYTGGGTGPDDFTFTTTTKAKPTIVSGFSKPSAWYQKNFPVLSSGGYFPSAQAGRVVVPRTGLMNVHRGEEIVPKGKQGEGEAVTIINVFDEALIPSIMAKYPNAIINPVLKAMRDNPVVRKIVKGAVA